MQKKLLKKVLLWAAPPLAAAFILFIIIAVICSYTALAGGTDSDTVSTVTSSVSDTANLTGNADGLPVSKNLIAFLESWEGYSEYGERGEDYWNVTIGYGHVEQAGESFTSLTSEQAEQLLISDLKTRGYISSVQNEFAGCTLSQNQFDALVSLCYNIGTGAWAELNLTTDVKNGAGTATLKSDFEAICHVGDQQSAGLLRRRNAEWLMFTQNIYQLNS